MYIPKRGSTKMRPLGIPAMADRAMQTLYLLALDPIAEVTSDPNSYGFRRERAPADAIAQCFTVLSNRYAPPWILEGDIRSCFDEISHDWLLAHVPTDTAILRKWLKAGLHGQARPAPDGGRDAARRPALPRGGQPHPRRLGAAAAGPLPADASQSTTKVNLVRFADDFIITGASREVLEDEVKPLVEAFLRERGLTLSPRRRSSRTSRTASTSWANTSGSTTANCSSRRRKKSVKTLLDEVRAMVKANRQAKAGNLICQLNPLLRGWAQYHRHVVSKETFAAVDAAVFKAVWQLGQATPPHKCARWVREQYFRTQGRRRWVFTGEVAAGAGPPRTVRALLRPARADPSARQGAGGGQPVRPGLGALLRGTPGRDDEAGPHRERRYGVLWNEQDGRCPVCRQPITPQTEWHLHHLVWRSKGGSDRADNQVLLHPNCHRQVHSQGLTVGKPRPARGDREARAG